VLTDALREMGLEIHAVLGHSVGEVAAAWASGALSLEQAVCVIHARSEHQESVRGKGLMAAVMLSEQDAKAALLEGKFSGVAISAVNSYRSVTLSGPAQSIKDFVAHAQTRNWNHKQLEID